MADINQAGPNAPGQHPNPSWGPDRLAPLQTRYDLRRERRESALAGDDFNHTAELADIRRAEREGERGAGAQLSSGSQTGPGSSPTQLADVPGLTAQPGAAADDGGTADGTQNGLAGNGAGTPQPGQDAWGSVPQAQPAKGKKNA